MFNWLKKKLIGFIKKVLPFLFDDKITRNVCYKTIRYVESTLQENSIRPDEFVIVDYKGKLYWALFECPCGCHEVITLPLKKEQNPNWTFNTSENRRPTLYPSVWRNKGCQSHFWVKDGIVKWCQNTGQHPSESQNLNNYFSL